MSAALVLLQGNQKKPPKEEKTKERHPTVDLLLGAPLLFRLRKKFLVLSLLPMETADKKKTSPHVSVVMATSVNLNDISLSVVAGQKGPNCLKPKGKKVKEHNTRNSS